MSERNSILVLEDILQSIRNIFDYTHGISYEHFLSDDKTRDAVIRNFEIIGEAANRLGTDIKNENAFIDWKRLRGLRNRIVHDYMGIDYKIVWNIIQHFLPDLSDKIKLLLHTNPGE